jgi:hypothetical protein
MIIKQRDLYTRSVTAPLRSGAATIGSTTIQYEVERYVDLRNLQAENAFLVTCTQRIIIPNNALFDPTAQTITGFVNYPALITNAVSLDDPDNVVSSIVLVDYSPKTANTAVTTSQNQGSSTSTSNTQQYSSGSSVAQTNTFGLSASTNFSLTSLPKYSDSSSMSTSSTRQASRSRSTANAVDNGAQFSSDASMALKDWGSYVQLDTTNTMPTWIWGQEYPWDLIDFRNKDNNDNIILPQYVIDRLWDGTQVYPPSELSLLGVNFASKVGWLLFLEPGTTDTSSLSFGHSLTLCTASHGVSGSPAAFTATIDTYPNPAVNAVTGLDLPVLALDPLSGGAGAALIGFVPGQFAVEPDSSGATFAIAAESNQLLARGTGFIALSQSGFMSTDFSQGSVTLSLWFKVTDSSSDISLSFKHWIDGGTGVTLSIAINGGAPITRHLDAPEAGSGGDNVTVVPLRRKDFSSVDYCDLLGLGLNTIEVTMTSDAGSPAANYTLMAVAVG